MRKKLVIAIALATVGLSASASTVQLFDATPITDSGFAPNIAERYVFKDASTTVYCEGAGTAQLRTTGDDGNNLIVDNYVTLNDADGQSICTGGTDGLPDPIAGTNCFSSGSSSGVHHGKDIEDVFSSNATAPVGLVDGQNDLTLKLWDWGGVYGNTALELALPDNCSTEPPFTVSLCAAQTEDIGVVGVTHDDDNLYVSFEIVEPDWYLAETHVAVGSIPTNRAGNPQPGQFPFSCEDSGTLAAGDLSFSCVATVPRGDLSGDVTIAAHASVFKLAGDGCGQDTQFASEVFDVNQGFNNDGSYVLPERSDPEAVFAANGPFFSLGFGGELTVGFGAPVFNGPGNDVCIQEITNGRSSYPEELAEVYGVTDEAGSLLGTVSNRANNTGLACVDLDADTAEAVKLVDVTDPTIHNDNADGYDIDWIGACYLYLGDETAWGAACYADEGERISSRGNWGTQFTYTID